MGEVFDRKFRRLNMVNLNLDLLHNVQKAIFIKFKNYIIHILLVKIFICNLANLKDTLK